jgi:putative transcriptional regulator
MSKKKKVEEPIRYNRLKIILAVKNISQKELAEMVDVERNTISRISNNKNQPSIQLLYKIAALLNVEISELLTPLGEIKSEVSKKGSK